QSFVAIAIFFSKMSTFADPNVGETYRISFVDVDGNTLSTADGRITTVVLTTRANIEKARTVGDRTPDFCLGNSNYRMITVLAFERIIANQCAQFSARSCAIDSSPKQADCNRVMISSKFRETRARMSSLSQI